MHGHEPMNLICGQFQISIVNYYYNCQNGVLHNFRVGFAHPSPTIDPPLMATVTTDLFASLLTMQSPKFFSWRPDPQALATDALIQNCSGMIGKSPNKISITPLSGIITDSSSMAKPTLVSSFTGPTNILPTSDTTLGRHDDRL